MKRSWPIAFDKLPASIQSLSLSDSVESQDSNEPNTTNGDEEQKGKQSVDVEVDGEETSAVTAALGPSQEETGLALETAESPPSLFSATPPIEANLQWEADDTQNGDTIDSQNTVGWDIGGSPVHAAEPASMDGATMGMEQPGADAAAGPPPSPSDEDGTDIDTCESDSPNFQDQANEENSESTERPETLPHMSASTGLGDMSCNSCFRVVYCNDCGREIRWRRNGAYAVRYCSGGSKGR